MKLIGVKTWARLKRDFMFDEEIIYGEKSKYIDTIQLKNGNCVLHIFELTS